jgi:hypothetical protein
LAEARLEIEMNESLGTIAYEHLPFYITGPGEIDILFGAVTVSLVAILIGFGALYFTIQAIPDRLVEGAGKAQMQVVGLLGLISLFTMNNAYWIAAILLAAVRIPDIVTPLKEIAKARIGNAELADSGEPLESHQAKTPADSVEDGVEEIGDEENDK